MALKLNIPSDWNWSGFMKRNFNPNPKQLYKPTTIFDPTKGNPDKAAETVIEDDLLNPEQDSNITDMDMYVSRYKSMVDETNKKANLLEAGKLAVNIGSLFSAINLEQPPKIEVPKVVSPKFVLPGQVMTDLQDKLAKKSINTANSYLINSGRQDLIPANTANALSMDSEIANKSILADIETLNKQAEVDAEAANKSGLLKMEARSKNIENQIKYNLMRGQGITESLNALGEQGQQYINRLNQSDYAKFVADITNYQSKLTTALYNL